MIGSMLSIGGYVMVLLALEMWIIFKVYRSDPFMAVMVFVFPPLTLYALVRYWGDEDSDVRIPVFMSLLTVGMIFFMANRFVEKGAEEIALMLTPEDIALLREENPELAMEIELQRAILVEQGVLGPDEAIGFHASDDFAPELMDLGYGQDTIPDEAQADDDEYSGELPVEAPVERSPEAIAAERRFHLQQAAAALVWRFGSVAIDHAGVRIDLPPSFRFVGRDALVRLAKLRGEPLGENVLGWLVHRRTDLARDEAWFVEVGTRPVVAAASDWDFEDPSLLADALQSLYAASPEQVALGPLAPVWDGKRRALRWSERDAEGEPARYLALLPAGAQPIQLAFRNVDAGEQELAERAVRLLSARVTSAGATHGQAMSATR